MLHVSWLCYQAAEYYRDCFNPRQIRNLLIAALFHDFDHPANRNRERTIPDGINIGRAIAALRRHLAREDRPFLPAIEALIEGTHYPYAVAGEQLDLSGPIIRDADLAQSLSPVWIQQVVIGLARERRVSPLEILKMQPAFPRSGRASGFRRVWSQRRSRRPNGCWRCWWVVISRTVHFDWPRPAK
jgi:hypothetical protein